MEQALPFSFAQSNSVLLKHGAQGVEMFFTSDTTLNTLNQVSALAQGKVAKPRMIGKKDFEEKLSLFYSHSIGEDSVEFDHEEVQGLIDIAEDVNASSEILDDEIQAPIIKLLNSLLARGIKKGASDIHIEPGTDQLLVRFRIDGILSREMSYSNKISNLVLARIKVISGLDIAEKRRPQDGAFNLTLAGKKIDVRVSTVVSIHGEKAVLRLLDKSSGLLQLSELNMPEKMHNKAEGLLSKSHGLLLVTGPTGSGKTTTLYSSLSYLNDPAKNIMTLEDPVEYRVAGLNQTQVNAKTGFTFKSGLRAILRQDPDIVMVGEIRDEETARIAIQSSLTGHLVLSTLHTNSTFGTISRLKDMGIEPFLLSSGLVGVIAQRLVRKLCEFCKKQRAPNDIEKEILGREFRGVIYDSCGCPECGNTGYKGRIAIFELLEVDEKAREMVYRDASEDEFKIKIEEEGLGLKQHGFDLVSNGKTTLSEVYRVVQE